MVRIAAATSPAPEADEDATMSEDQLLAHLLGDNGRSPSPPPGSGRTSADNRTDTEPNEARDRLSAARDELERRITEWNSGRRGSPPEPGPSTESMFRSAGETATLERARVLHRRFTDRLTDQTTRITPESTTNTDDATDGTSEPSVSVEESFLPLTARNEVERFETRSTMTRIDEGATAPGVGTRQLNSAAPDPLSDCSFTGSVRTDPGQDSPLRRRGRKSSSLRPADGAVVLNTVFRHLDSVWIAARNSASHKQCFRSVQAARRSLIPRTILLVILVSVSCVLVLTRIVDAAAAGPLRWLTLIACLLSMLEICLRLRDYNRKKEKLRASTALMKKLAISDLPE